MTDEFDDKPPRLPQSGLADEILSALREGKLRNGEPAATTPTDGEEGSTEIADSPVDRIYTFTDSLQLGEEEEEERETYETWVEFSLASQPFALPVAQVREILRVGELTPVPQAPFPVLGVFNLRGRVVPLIDLRARLGLPATAAGPTSRIVVVESRRRRIGLLVDSVERISRLARSGIRAPGEEMPIAGVRGVYEAESGEIPLLGLEEILRLPEAAEDERDRVPPGPA